MEKIEQRLLALYSEEKAVPVIIKLKNLIRNLNYNTHKKGIAIFVSPVVEQVYYLEAEVEEKIAIDEFFEVRDEVFRKKRTISSASVQKYILMAINLKPVLQINLK